MNIKIIHNISSLVRIHGYARSKHHGRDSALKKPTLIAHLIVEKIRKCGTAVIVVSEIQSDSPRRYIVVSAYYDGLGVLDGSIYPGADANASGVGVLLSLVRSLPEFCKGDTLPRRQPQRQVPESTA